MELATYQVKQIQKLVQLEGGTPEHNLLHQTEMFRLDASRRLHPKTRSELGQFLTPMPVARLMASLFTTRSKEVLLLEPGAGVGSLIAATVVQFCLRSSPPAAIRITAYEIDPILSEYLHETLRSCDHFCRSYGVAFSATVCSEDFMSAAAAMVTSDGLFEIPRPKLNCGIINPPYKKISSNSDTKIVLRDAGIEVTNTYAAFVALAVKLLTTNGQLVTITPRSFCNGPYFQKFRSLLFSETDIRRIHVFESRTSAFKDDDVLQETVIMHLVKTVERALEITISASDGPADFVTLRKARREEIINPSDPKQFLRIVSHNDGRRASATVDQLTNSLEDLRITVSTGRVVDFRAKSHLRQNPEPDTVPLIYPVHFENGRIKWPKIGMKKPNAIVGNDSTLSLLVPSEFYVFVKRFSSKEEPRRVVAAIYDPDLFECDFVGIENHINYFHCDGRGLSKDLAYGLAAYLNSSIVETYFRTFNGHTQVNAGDLRNIPFPDRLQLETLGKHILNKAMGVSVDEYLHTHIIPMVAERSRARVSKSALLNQAKSILSDLGMPGAQSNERSALTLLALLDMKPGFAWEDASAPLRGITEMMDFFRDNYGKDYKPNTRETVRRQTIHQFVDAGLAHPNPDNPNRPINSPDYVYQVDETALDVIRSFGTDSWETLRDTYLSSVETLKTKYAQERTSARIPICLSNGIEFTLSPGGQNVLVQKILTEFCPRFTPEGEALYIGDTDKKWLHFDIPKFADLNVQIDKHGKMPDIVIYYKEKNWLVLVEAVTSHGPVDSKRREELKTIFRNSSAGLVYVTAFLSRRAMLKYLNSISWETEVWVAESPTHLIHFNGDRFLGPYTT